MHTSKTFGGWSCLPVLLQVLLQVCLHLFIQCGKYRPVVKYPLVTSPFPKMHEPMPGLHGVKGNNELHLQTETKTGREVTATTLTPRAPWGTVGALAWRVRCSHTTSPPLMAHKAVCLASRVTWACLSRHNTTGASRFEEG